MKRFPSACDDSGMYKGLFCLSGLWDSGCVICGLPCRAGKDRKNRGVAIWCIHAERKPVPEGAGFLFAAV